MHFPNEVLPFRGSATKWVWVIFNTNHSISLRLCFIIHFCLTPACNGQSILLVVNMTSARVILRLFISFGFSMQFIVLFVRVIGLVKLEHKTKPLSCKWNSVKNRRQTKRNPFKLSSTGIAGKNIVCKPDTLILWTCTALDRSLLFLLDSWFAQSKTSAKNV